MNEQPTTGSKDTAETSASTLIDARIRELNDWRGETLARVRASSRRRTRKRSRNGSGEAFRSGRTAGSCAPAKPTSPWSS